MQFKSGHDDRRNLKGRPRGAKDKRNLIIKALEDVYGETGELGFWTQVGHLAKNGETAAMQLIASRLAPPLKSVEGDPEVLLELERLRLEMRAEYAERILKAKATAVFSHFVHLKDVDINDYLAKANEIYGLSDDELDNRIETLKKEQET